MTHPELLNLLCTVLPFLEDAQEDACYKNGVVTRLIARVKTAITELEAQQ
jgi:hypothetical protein